MAFKEKFETFANKAAGVAGDTFDYGKAKGKIVIEKSKVKDAKETLGAYVYETLKNGVELDMDRVKAFCAEIESHVAEIEKLEEDARESSRDLSSKISGGKK